LTRGLGPEIQSRGLAITGRETVGDFDNIPFADQVRTVADDLLTHFWHTDARVIANSFGAYLFLQAQATLEPFPGRVLLLSALLGDGENPATGQSFMLPRTDSLKQKLQSGTYPVPKALEVHVGALDWQANPERWLAHASQLGFDLCVVPGGGHRLDHEYVGSVLNSWLQPDPDSRVE
jgi:hypothetical protein